MQASLFLVAAACAPSTQFNRGISVDFRPAAANVGQDRIVGSALAVEAKDVEVLKAQSAVYLGELEAAAERDSGQSETGAKSLEGRMSIEAAQRGATHFELTASEVTTRLAQASPGPSVGGPVGITSNGGIGFGSNGAAASQVKALRVRYRLYRVEAPGWSALPGPLQPKPFKST